MFSDAIVKDENGTYRWTYEMNMWKNSTILITVWKILLIGTMFPVMLVTILALIEDGPLQAIKAFVSVFPLLVAIFIGVLLIAYPFVAILNGGRYQVVFELDAKGINHIQVQKQFKKNQVMGWITAMAGAASGNLSVAGAGLLAASKSNSYSQFSKVKKIVAKPKRHVIYVNEQLDHNQVYVHKEDYDEVLKFIIEHCPKASHS